jgi:DNA-binding IclR family transcriptional regulator
MASVKRKRTAKKKVSDGAQRRRPKWAAAERAPAVASESRYQTKAIARALDVLEAFDDGRTALNLRDLNRLTGLPESSLFRVLITLQGRGYLQQSEDGAYRLAPKVLLGKLFEQAERFRELARPKLQALASHFNETASLAYLFGERIQVIDSVDSFHDIRISNRPGRVLPPHCSAMGKAITAFQPSSQMDRIIEVYGLTARTKHSICDRRELIKELGKVRELGLAYDREESTLGGICIAAPIRLPSGAVWAAASLSTPIARLNAEREQEIAEGVLQTTKEIAALAARAGR